ncbi:hypothetical protein KL930_001982 [Ogataea haglerorum]|uniref:Uncharacterized protein n=1 Tax=Ogataea haglerorum TaxID=1937702 RepID=A0AAN6DA91_9ASCO|nr:uncharacterized protein KL911_001923 [Ogataea haglerorum]KAG7698321.1 hypothetical protein KL915_002038 [Ogataea haglerorum]KAG7699386.1 hypothetical protein KL951_001103 [Ogataea haglerorum]KAG7708542.1 hypothetical protein KL914_002268 [Ogataea haglerorum]KAG7721053.1 hypothetical protein KL913_000789 [Ogataea haglerorum]KAG7721807.1 hypothetical protein KL949_000785 [Ogataea haglerorum]
MAQLPKSKVSVLGTRPRCESFIISAAFLEKEVNQEFDHRQPRITQVLRKIVAIWPYDHNFWESHDNLSSG